jgi:hypothetical protein
VNGKSMHILVVDIGGTKIKVLASGQLQPKKIRTAHALAPEKMVEMVKRLTRGWEYEAVSIGVPALVGMQGIRQDPGNLGTGWIGFDFATAFGVPAKVINDAAMQALGSYEGGRMLFLGLGTGVGSTLIAERVVTPLELGCLPYRKGKTMQDFLSRKGLRWQGRRLWCREVLRCASLLHHAFSADYVVLGGGNARLLRKLGPDQLPAGVRIGHNRNAFRGGFRLWGYDLVPTLTAEGPDDLEPATPAAEWRLV